MRGSCLQPPKFSLQLGQFSLSYAMRNLFGMFLFAFWVILRPQHVEVVIFPKFWLHASLLKDIDMPKLLGAHALWMHTCVTHTQCDITRVCITCKPHHHDIISIHIPIMPCRTDVV